MYAGYKTANFNQILRDILKICIKYERLVQFLNLYKSKDMLYYNKVQTLDK